MDEFLRSTRTAETPRSPIGKNGVPGVVALRGSSASPYGSIEPYNGISRGPASGLKYPLLISRHEE